MAKKDKISGAAVPAYTLATPASESASAAEAKEPSKIGVKGLKGIPLSAKITLLAAKNPKRPGCGAEKRFALYKTGMTQEEFLAAGGTTPDMAYDTAHGYISVEGYVPPKTFTPKVREPKAPKEPKAQKAKKEKVVKEPAVESAELAAATTEEVVD